MSVEGKANAAGKMGCCVRPTEALRRVLCKRPAEVSRRQRHTSRLGVRYSGVPLSMPSVVRLHGTRVANRRRGTCMPRHLGATTEVGWSREWQTAGAVRDMQLQSPAAARIEQPFMKHFLVHRSVPSPGATSPARCNVSKPGSWM